MSARDARGPASAPWTRFVRPRRRRRELNAEGKTFYRQGKWDDARAKYRAAEAADAEFLAPRLNVACSFVRQERFAEATAEVKTLIDRAYVPWAREVLEAADLGALKVHAVMPQIRAAMTEAAAAWGAGLDDAVLFVGRPRAPLRIPAQGDGVFILNPHQEVYAFIPATGRFRQLTAEDGRVLAFVRSKDRRRIMYATGDKLVRGPGASVVLRGVSLHELTLATMTTAPPIPIEGDVRRLEMSGSGAFAIQSDKIAGVYARGGDKGGALVPRREAVRGGAVLTPAGALQGKRHPRPGPRRAPAASRPPNRRRRASRGRWWCRRRAGRRAESAKASARVWPDFRYREPAVHSFGNLMSFTTKNLRWAAGRIMCDHVGKSTSPLDHPGVS